MTPDRLVNLGRMVIHPKKLAQFQPLVFLIHSLQVLERGEEDALPPPPLQKKLVYRRLGKRRIFLIYFQPSYGILLFLT